MRPATPAPGSALHLPSLAAGLAIMLGATFYPPLLVGAAGQVDHRLASLLFLAMSAGLVRGVGFVPRSWPWRALFSGWSCTLALAAALWAAWPA